MSEHRATVTWQHSTPRFEYSCYNRDHEWSFDGGICVPASAAPGNIPASAPRVNGVDPEQAFVAALSSCHMLWFLHIACEQGYTIARYRDAASGTLSKNDKGRIAVTRVVLRPEVLFEGITPDGVTHAALHEQAHDKCFIANSVTAQILLEPRFC